MREIPYFKVSKQYKALAMVLILDSNSEIGAHVRSNLGYLTCLRHLISSVVTKIPAILHACATCSELPPIIGTGTATITVQKN